jgi:cytoskeletal protein CcmA (bactofilin family)
MDQRFAVLIAVLLVLAVVPAPAAAQEARTGDTVVVAEGETVDGDLRAFAGTVIVRGTVNGDLTAFTGNVFVDGEVNGDLQAFSGNVRINGTVTGGVSTAGGNVILAQEGRVGGQFQTGAGNVVVEGEIGGDASLDASTITVGPTATIGGDLAYDGNLTLSEEARIGGEVRQEDDLGPGFQGPLVPNWVGWAYGLLANLLLGAVALLVFPRFSAGLADRAASDPLRSAGVGLLLFVAVPVLLILLFISLIGIPLGLIGMLVYGLLLWLGYVYGSFAVGSWLLSLADPENRWLALFVGLLAISLIGLLPILGGLVQFVVLLLGLGALGLGLRNRYRGRRAARARTGPSGPETVS